MSQHISRRLPLRLSCFLNTRRFQLNQYWCIRGNISRRFQGFFRFYNIRLNQIGGEKKFFFLREAEMIDS